jgi:hypothetical protein
MERRGLIVGAVVLVAIVLWILASDKPTLEEPLPVGPSAALPESQRVPGPVAEQAAQPPTTEAQVERKPDPQAAPASPAQAPAAPEQPEEPAPVPRPEPSGPIAEMKKAFEDEPRDSAAQAVESRIEAEFRKNDIAPGLLKSVLCRKSVCKVEVLWTPERALAFMSAFTRLSTEFQSDIAMDPRDPADARQPLQVDVYLPRAKPAER